MTACGNSIQQAVRVTPGCHLFLLGAKVHDPADDLDPDRPHLEVLARVHLDPRLRGKLDPAEVALRTYPNIQVAGRVIGLRSRHSGRSVASVAAGNQVLGKRLRLLNEAEAAVY
jgi:hypothetical protein